MRTIVAALLATTLSASAALALPDTGPLPAGKPAGVRQAQEDGHTMLFIAGAALVGIGVALAVSNNGNNTTPSTSSGISTTSTTP
jgi:hypothetical protein